MRLVDGPPAYVYVLFEHKSYPDPLTPFQLLRYLVRIWEQELRQGAESLTPVIPLVVYHGLRAWPVGEHFGALFAGPEPLRAYWPEFRFQVYDLSAYGDEEIRGAALLQGMLLLLKYQLFPLKNALSP